MSPSNLPPAVAEFVNGMTDCTRMLALEFAGRPDEVVIPHLDRFIAQVKPRIVELVGPDTAAKMLDTLRAGALGHKHDIEAAAASGSMARYLEVLSK
jgi:hypothetical protein